jgi:hypothetical protein
MISLIPFLYFNYATIKKLNNLNMLFNIELEFKFKNLNFKFFGFQNYFNFIQIIYH